jgi:hypothetical protein
MRRPKFITAVMAKTWKNGRMPMMRSSPMRMSLFHDSIWSTFVVRLAWVSMAPLGTPVVPPVYCRSAMSSFGLMTAGSNWPSLSMRLSQSTQRSATASPPHGPGRRA